MLIGVDLGGTFIKVGLVDFEGNILRMNSRPTYAQRGYTPIIRTMAEQIRELAEAQGIGMEDIHSIGIGVPGPVEYTTGRVLYCSNLSWRNVELGTELNSMLGKSVYVENDATAAGLGESLFGSTRGAENSVLLTLGTGIGSGIIINGSIYRGSHAAGSEIGHTIIGENFYDCNCGNNGCFETFASASAIIKYAQHRISNDRVKTLILESAFNKAENITAEIIFEAAKKGDALALETVDRMCKYLAIGILNIYNMLDPDIIALGGGVSESENFPIEQVKKKVNEMVFSKDVRYGEIVQG